MDSLFSHTAPQWLGLDRRKPLMEYDTVSGAHRLLTPYVMGYVLGMAIFVLIRLRTDPSAYPVLLCIAVLLGGNILLKILRPECNSVTVWRNTDGLLFWVTSSTVVVFTGGDHSPLWTLFIIGAIVPAIYRDSVGIYYNFAFSLIALVIVPRLTSELDPVGASNTFRDMLTITFAGFVTYGLSVNISSSESSHSNHQRLLILNSTTEGIFGVDPEGCLTFINAAAARMLGYEQEELTGASHYIFHHSLADDEDLVRKHCPILKTMADGKPYYVAEEMFSHKDGSPFLVSYNASPIYDMGKLMGAVVAFNDITTLRQTERLADIGKSISGLAHCLKNILNNVRSGSYAVEKQISHKSISHHKLSQDWNTIKHSIHLLSEVVLNMLSYSKQRTQSLCACDLVDLSDDVVTMLEEQAIERGIRLVHEYHSQAPKVALLDEVTIRRCLLNLIGNAFDACDGREDAVVTLEITGAPHTDAGFSIIVSDNGIGMTDEALAHLFTPFFTTKGSHGTGLGLAVTKKLINEHGGEVVITTNPGMGTSVSLEFPTALLEVERCESRQATQHTNPT